MTKAITLAPKVFFYDCGEVTNEDLGAKFENLVAAHLLKKIHYLEDFSGDRYQLHYVRDRNGHEVDFVIICNGRPMILIEAKVSDEVRSRSLYYFMEKMKIKHAVQLVLNCQKQHTRDGILVVNAAQWLSRPLGDKFCPEK